MKMIVSALISSILLLCTFNAQAQKAAKLPCEKRARTQNELNQCAGSAFEKADAEMNRVYQPLMSATARRGESYQQKLKEAQQAWLKYRDATCESEAAINAEGTIYPTAYNYCLAQVTTERTKRLAMMMGGMLSRSDGSQKQ